ncbi:hypothetical protein SEA_TROJE_30 [Gordonia phage Troje]|uniref:Uncharacterized protein n=2 Tax=Emalynvirus troje TaxID=2560511 RepID=A0A2K9VEN3_9CAUD|nr:hypothetical protein FDJ27_gp30 [Gordonia phage Troje]AUV60736.1 hypothetical protein SEA_TROJE_30 [Gordonia phage Troje]QNJ59460.1 hypothetical protein SEA_BUTTRMLKDREAMS_30 [Gordonia phage Buttrmlkdreams]
MVQSSCSTTHRPKEHTMKLRLLTAASAAAIALSSLLAPSAFASSEITQDLDYGPSETFTPRQDTIIQGDYDGPRERNYDSPGVAQCPGEAISRDYVRDSSGDYSWVCRYA